MSKNSDCLYGYNRMTNIWYRIDDWVVTKGQIVSKNKTEVPRKEVPQEWIDGYGERGNDAE